MNTRWLKADGACLASTAAKRRSMGRIGLLLFSNSDVDGHQRGRQMAECAVGLLDRMRGNASDRLRIVACHEIFCHAGHDFALKFRTGQVRIAGRCGFETRRSPHLFSSTRPSRVSSRRQRALISRSPLSDWFRCSPPETFHNSSAAKRAPPVIGPGASPLAAVHVSIIHMVQSVRGRMVSDVLADPFRTGTVASARSAPNATSLSAASTAE